MTDQDYRILIVNSSEYESLFAEIYKEGKLVAIVSEERVRGVFDLETPGRDFVETHVLRRVEWNGFRDAVQRACEALRT